MTGRRQAELAAAAAVLGGTLCEELADPMAGQAAGSRQGAVAARLLNPSLTPQAIVLVVSSAPGGPSWMAAWGGLVRQAGREAARVQAACALRRPRYRVSLFCGCSRSCRASPSVRVSGYVCVPGRRALCAVEQVARAALALWTLHATHGRWSGGLLRLELCQGGCRRISPAPAFPCFPDASHGFSHFMRTHAPGCLLG